MGAGCFLPTPEVGARCHHLLRSTARPEVPPHPPLPPETVGNRSAASGRGSALPSCLVANQRPGSGPLLGQSGDVIVAGRFPKIRPMRRGRSGVPYTVLAQYRQSPRGPGCRRRANGRLAEARGGVASPAANGVWGAEPGPCQVRPTSKRSGLLGRGRGHFPNRGRPGAGRAAGGPMRHAAAAGLSRDGAGGGRRRVGINTRRWRLGSGLRAVHTSLSLLAGQRGGSSGFPAGGPRARRAGPPGAGWRQPSG